MNKLDESESHATPASVNGIGSVTFPTATTSGSGDLPLSLNRKGKVFKRFKEFVLIHRIDESNEHLHKVKTDRYVYHTSNPFYRDKISKEGLIVKGKSETWLSDTNINGKVIFAVNSENKKDWWDSTYDDDIYKIDTSKINNEWYNDPNFDIKHKRIITFENIPSYAIKLIYKGEGNSY